MPTCRSYGWMLFGLIVGVVAKLLMPGRDPGGMIVTILLGIGGALVGGFLGRVLGWYGDGDPVGFIMAVIGAMALLFAYRKLNGSSRVGTWDAGWRGTPRRQTTSVREYLHRLSSHLR